jgi:glyoxylase-like metal-dependent hydrolase (beta-lactamase superfamily II)
MDAIVRGVRHPWSEPPAPGAAVEIAEGVLWLRLPLPFRLNHLNVYALDDGDGWTIVDTGLGTATVRDAWAALRAGPLAGRPIRRVIVTHHHPDHVGLAGWFQADGAELWATRTAWLTARMLTLDVQPRPSAEALAFLRGAGLSAELLAERERERPFNFADVVAPMPLGFRRIVQGERIEAGGRSWRVEVGHGHAPEQATLWGDGHDLVLVGDQVLPGITPNLGVYPTEPDADPVGEWLASCARLQRIATPTHLALPGHRLPFTGLADRLEALETHTLTALERLRAHLAAPRRAVDCFEALFGRPIGSAELGLALAETIGHLNYLRARGEVARQTDADGAWLWRLGELGTDSAAAAR